MQWIVRSAASTCVGYVEGMGFANAERIKWVNSLAALAEHWPRGKLAAMRPVGPVFRSDRKLEDLKTDVSRTARIFT
ncbi:hypothetical protein ASD8599_01779 [Ascidiaceihabitans donghaensis]|uniref:Uncharacterized protein n=1 Tax=Ascidiaceihabitans donghaensis TaxID=1510460 RepID=A0A2R8BD79_9RHOB|nr:hypothetical protein ASD8599_01779 [Ascidiaceihabitans donghaensis]